MTEVGRISVVILPGAEAGDVDARRESIAAALAEVAHEVLVPEAATGPDALAPVRATLRSARGDVVVTMAPLPRGGSPRLDGIHALVQAVREDGAVVAGAPGVPLRAYPRRFLDDTTLEASRPDALDLELLVKARERGRRTTGVAGLPGPSRSRLRWIVRGLYGGPLSEWTGGAATRWFVPVVAFLWLANLHLPSLLAGDALDLSWQHVIQHLATSGALWGEDVAFTYGPLGWLFSPTFHDPLLLPQLGLGGLLSLALATWLARAAMRTGGRGAGRSFCSARRACSGRTRSS